MITLDMYTLNIILLVGKENSVEAAFHKRTGRMKLSVSVSPLRIGSLNQTGDPDCFLKKAFV